MSVEKITQTIVEDANQKAQDILKKAQIEADAFLLDAKKKSQKEVDHILDSAQEARQLLGEKIVSSEKTDRKKRLLQVKHDKIDAVFKASFSHFLTMEDKEYTALLENLILTNAQTGQEELILDGAFQSKLPKGFLIALNAKALTKGLKPSFKFAKESAEIGPGVILKHNNILINCSIKQLLYAQRERKQSDICKILFGE